jgi:hypothetical protein
MLAKTHKGTTLRSNRASVRTKHNDLIRMAKSCKPTMTYYERLDFYADLALKKHPKSSVVMNARTFEVVAIGTDIDKLAKKMQRANHADVEVMVGRPPVNHITMLRCR